MKKLIRSILILSIISLCGCTKIIYTHDEVLGRYKTRSDVEKTFGLPTEKKLSDTAEMWLYQYDRDDSFNRHSVTLHHNLQTITVDHFGTFNRYLIFSFDKKGNIARCDYTGVNLTVWKKDPWATAGLVAICVGVTIGAAAILAHDLTFWGD
ncbi:MAG TPA: hypothetical protein VL442_21145 [Mucilaginibacter sp.]|jgi:hypothetical protein|nr:hypothetical protein [Mucilaginibacter sp.]